MHFEPHTSAWQAPRKERTHVWHLLVCNFKGFWQLGWEWWDSKLDTSRYRTSCRRTRDTRDFRRRSERPVARGRCPKQTMSNMFVVILSSSLAVFDDFMLVLFVLRQGRGLHSTQSICYWHFHTLCIWLLFCEVLHQKPRKTTSRLPSCPLALSSFEVQEFLGALGYPVVHRLEVGNFYIFLPFLRNYMAALREARCDHHLDDYSLQLSSCMRCVEFDIRQAHGEVNDDAKEKTERTRW